MNDHPNDQTLALADRVDLGRMYLASIPSATILRVRVLISAVEVT